jgi:hypothetical protein
MCGILPWKYQLFPPEGRNRHLSCHCSPTKLLDVSLQRSSGLALRLILPMRAYNGGGSVFQSLFLGNCAA